MQPISKLLQVILNMNAYHLRANSSIVLRNAMRANGSKEDRTAGNTSYKLGPLRECNEGCAPREGCLGEVVFSDGKSVML